MEDQFNGWLTKAEAAQKTGISERTIERLVARGEIRQSYRHIPARRPITILHPEDIDKLKQKTLPPVPTPPINGALTKSMVTDRFNFLTPPRVAIKDKIFLTIDEAAELSGLPKAHLRRLIADESLPAIKAHGWRIRRADIEKL